MSDSDKKKPAVIARYKPYFHKLVLDKTYFWCACGLSKTQPFCDGSHRGSGFEPLKYVASSGEREVLFCGCKQSKNQPFCDGSHNNLRDTYEEDDSESYSNRNIPEVKHRHSGRLELNGHCYVMRVAEEQLETRGNLRWCCVIGGQTGARFQSQFYIEIGRGHSPVIGFDQGHVVLLATQGSGRLRIGPEIFELTPEMGAYVRPGEKFSLENQEDITLRLYVSVCPLADGPQFSGDLGGLFDRTYPDRTVVFDPDQRRKMGDRTFQLLVDKRLGSDLVTQFIGDIPQSKAMPHRHLYEESLIVLCGEGCMWTEDLKAEVKTGDVIFLPAQQIHSLQCTDPNGMTVAGVIYPGGNPDINY